MTMVISMDFKHKFTFEFDTDSEEIYIDWYGNESYIYRTIKVVNLEINDRVEYTVEIAFNHSDCINLDICYDNGTWVPYGAGSVKWGEGWYLKSFEIHDLPEPEIVDTSCDEEDLQATPEELAKIRETVISMVRDTALKMLEDHINKEDRNEDLPLDSLAHYY